MFRPTIALYSILHHDALYCTLQASDTVATLQMGIGLMNPGTRCLKPQKQGNTGYPHIVSLFDCCTLYLPWASMQAYCTRPQNQSVDSAASRQALTDWSGSSPSPRASQHYGAPVTYECIPSLPFIISLCNNGFIVLISLFVLRSPKHGMGS
ncbi:hypothetical protein F4802DRAFT_567163 [Xylaria palmicola]|nr:hypothetical protein F4802DRAFT_567163 [Xylaria palmicola]